MWRLCLIIRDVINTCDDTIYNLSAYVCDWTLGAHKILHPILSLKSGVTCPYWTIATNSQFVEIEFVGAAPFPKIHKSGLKIGIF